MRFCISTNIYIFALWLKILNAPSYIIYLMQISLRISLIHIKMAG